MGLPKFRGVTSQSSGKVGSVNQGGRSDLPGRCCQDPEILLSAHNQKAEGEQLPILRVLDRLDYFVDLHKVMVDSKTRSGGPCGDAQFAKDRCHMGVDCAAADD